MNITVKKPQLLKALRHLSMAVEVRTPIPILQNVLVEAHDYDKSVTLRAMDGITAIETQIPDCIVDKSGTISLPAKQLLGYVSSAPGETISMKATANHWCSLAAGSLKARMPGMSGESFPEFPKVGEARFTAPTVMFTMMAASVSHSVPEEQGMSIDDGVVLEVHEGTLKLAAIHPHHVAITEGATDRIGDKPYKVVVPQDSLKAACRIAESCEGAVSCYGDGSRLCLDMEGYRVHITLMSAKPPDYEKMLKHLNPKAQVTANRKALMDSLSRCVGFARDEKGEMAKVIVDVSTDTIAMWARREGECSDQLPALASDPIRFGMNAFYALDCLKSMDSDEVLIRYSDNKTGMIFEPVGAAAVKFLEVIMPMGLSATELEPLAA